MKIELRIEGLHLEFEVVEVVDMLHASAVVAVAFADTGVHEVQQPNMQTAER